MVRNLLDNARRHAGAPDRESGGSGLGLSIVKAAVEDLGRLVHVADSPLGGASFVVSIPTGGPLDPERTE